MVASVGHLGRYRLDGVIGTGSFATVHRATDVRLGDTVAVKLLADNHALDPDIRERFISEGRVLRRVDSPHVVLVHDVGETDQHQPYLVLALADRGSLARRTTDLWAEGWTPAAADVRLLARSLAEAIGALHRADLVHRDLSPGNVLIRSVPPGPSDRHLATLIGRDERLVLADLGLCKDLARNSGFTLAGGTEGFRPPEQRGRSGRVDTRADLWALSALVTWLLTREPPGEGPDARPVVDAVTAAGFPERLGEVLAVSLADDPQDRHPDVTAWLGELEAALGGHEAAPPAGSLGGAARAAGSTDPAPPDVPEAPTAGTSPRRRPRRLVGLGIMGAGAALGATVALNLVASGGDGFRDTSLQRRDDNQVAVVDEDDSARLALVGPEQVAVGEDTVLEVEADDVDRWVWLMPDGATYDDEERVRLQATSAGRARVILVGFSSAGERLEVVHDLDVRP